VEYAYLQLVQN
jgi:ubiquinone/menaquinone biosynthesis C-methylase UbiE